MTDSGGYLKLHRAAFRKVYPQGMAVWGTFTWLLGMAQWRPGGGLRPGQVLCTVSGICGDSGLSRQQVRTALEKLERDERIVRTSMKGKTLVTLLNWSIYQGRTERRERVTGVRPPDMGVPSDD